MSDEGDNERRRPRAQHVHGAASADLLDLVRSAEEGATVATKPGARKTLPSVPPRDRADADEGAARDDRGEEFVDVGDDAVDDPSESRTTSLPPAAGVLLLLVLAIGTLALVAR